MSILTPAYCNTVKAAAVAYLLEGVSVIPLIGKKAAIGWANYQNSRAINRDIVEWDRSRKLQNIGVVCGKVSGNLVVIDLDGAAAVAAFEAEFPQLCRSTFTVRTNSGKHIYLYINQLPANRKVSLGTDHNGIEIRGNGCYVVAPPSIHPDSHLPYVVCNHVPPLRIPQLRLVAAWLDALASENKPDSTPPPPAPPPQYRHSFVEPGKIRSPRAWTIAAVSNECRAVQTAREGMRNDRLNTAAYNLGQIVGIGWLTWNEAERVLADAAKGAGLGERESLNTIQSGLRKGSSEPRDTQWNRRSSH
jgi:hypothetical protein